MRLRLVIIKKKATDVVCRRDNDFENRTTVRICNNEKRILLCKVCGIHVRHVTLLHRGTYGILLLLYGRARIQWVAN